MSPSPLLRSAAAADAAAAHAAVADAAAADPCCCCTTGVREQDRPGAALHGAIALIRRGLS